jgi:glycosyltransferase involved in cell wall biosynthesis
MSARILFVHNRPTKSVRVDLAVLRERYEVCEWFPRRRPINLLALARAVAQSDVVFGWRASWHTLLPLMLARSRKRPSLLVVGGYDTASMPEIAYGSQRGGSRRWIARAAMQSASTVLALSEFSRREAVANGGVDPRRVCTVYLGIEDCDCPALLPKENVALTVGSVDRVNLQRKGLETFVRTAALLPEVPFVVVGQWRDRAIDELRAIASPNMQFTGWLTDNTLREHYVQARVYVQASRHAGFGLAVAEAMSFECVPVVTRAGALPEVVGTTGVYLNSSEPQAVADAVRRALTLDEQRGLRARARISLEFSLQRRREKLFELVDGVS